MKKVALLATLALFTTSMFAQWGTGMEFDPNAMGKIQKQPGSFGFSGSLPSKYSLKKYTPYPKSQGKYGTCASWATGYSAMTTQYAMLMNMTNRNVITAKAFCPYFIHNNSKTVTDTCAGGNGFSNFIDLLKNEGCKRFYLPLINCGTTYDQKMLDGANNYRIKSMYRNYLYDGTYANDEAHFTDFFNKEPFDVESVKKLLVSDYVPIFAMYVPKSFHGINSEIWNLTAEEKADPVKTTMGEKGKMHSAHAMTIVSYDDDKYGGAFEIMNSWGTGFGDDGYVWVRYADLQKYVYWIVYLDIAKPGVKTGTGCIYGDCDNGYGITKFESGDVYEGFFKNGRYHGLGIYTWSSGSSYAGEWENGKRQGDATNYYKDGSYGGVTYLDDKFSSGYDIISYDNGNSYEGNIKSGDFHGYGKFKFASGDEYEGEFKNGKYDGLGRYTFASGTQHIGYFSGGKFNGYGIQISSSGKVWGGKWSYGTFSTGKTYGFANKDESNTLDIPAESNDYYMDAACTSGDCLNGKGKRVYSGGLKYEGQFKDGLAHGIGTTTYKNGTSVETFYDDGSMGGPAVLTDYKGNIQIGFLIDGNWDGYAVCIYKSGSIVIHKYNKGKYIGQMTTANQTETEITKVQEAEHTNFKEETPQAAK